MTDEEKVVLYINDYDSRCGACNKNADPGEVSHNMTSYIKGDPGCGKKFTHVSSYYPDIASSGRLREMRPDLIPIGVMDSLTDRWGKDV